MKPQFKTEYAKVQKHWEDSYLHCVEKTSYVDTPDALKEAIMYSVQAGGKRLRPVLGLSIAKYISLPDDIAMSLATSLEFLHTYSLIHDDLPSMDNDDFRRGLPTNHRVYGEGNSVLAGDALHSLAYELLIQTDPPTRLLTYFASCVGPAGMIGGQYLDINASNEKNESYLINMHRMKTGRLIQAACMMPFLYDNPEADYRDLENWSADLGLLFQIVDDILDATSSTNKLGKTAGKDNEQNKLTYLSIYGSEKANSIAKTTSETLSKYAKEKFSGSFLLENIGKFILSRTY